METDNTPELFMEMRMLDAIFETISLEADGRVEMELNLTLGRRFHAIAEEFVSLTGTDPRIGWGSI